MKKKRLYYMDILRIFSMCVVVYYHLTGCINNWTDLPFKLPFQFSNGLSFGSIAVSIFFIISGASLYYSNDLHTDFSAKSYYKKRLKTILPLFWITWLLFFLYNFYFRTFTVDSSIPTWTIILTALGVDQYVNAITGIQTFGIISEWFLGCIIIIYILFPIIRIIFIRYTKSMMSILCVSYIFLMLFGGRIVSLDFNVGIRIFEFTLGMCLIRYLPEIKKGKFTYLAFFILCLLILLVISYPPIIERLITTLVAICIYMICFLAFYNIRNSKIKRTLLLSKYSYAVFLNHHTIMAFVFLDYIQKKGSLAITYRDVLALNLIVILLIVVCSVLLVKIEKSIVGFFCSKKV